MDLRIIETKLKVIYDKRIVTSTPIENIEVRIADYVSPGEYAAEQEWHPLGPDERWPACKTVFLRFTVAVPPAAEHHRPELYLDFEGVDGLLSLDGIPFAGIDVNHDSVAVAPAASYSAEIEGATWLRALHDSAYAGRLAWLRSAEVRLVDTRVETLWYDFSFAHDASKAVTDRRRGALLARAIEDGMLAVDVTRQDSAFVEELTRGGKILNTQIAAIGHDPQDLNIALTAHAHIDVAWLWTLGESVRKCSRTFSTVARLMERYPEFRFSCSQPVLYEYTKDYYPELYKQIKKWVSEGRWETTGGMWVEADCNVSSGEALIRQTLYGLRFFREEFGTRPKECWLPDVFGYSAALPQILKACGIDRFFTVKLHRQSRNRFPHTLFWWRGIDGSRVLAHIPRLSHMYNSQMEPTEFRDAEAEVDQLPSCDTVLMPFGYGDGGGGPTEKMLEYAERGKEFPGLPSCRHTGSEGFFDSVLAAEPVLPEWTGELYLETHRGTLTSQASTKKANRRNEIALRDAEILGWMAAMAGKPVDLLPLESAWKKLLTLQFHDILPGSSIGTVYREAAEDYREIAAVCAKVKDRALLSLAADGDSSDLLLVNTLSWARSDLAAVSLPFSDDVVELVDAEGSSVTCQRIGAAPDGSVYVFLQPDVPSLGYTHLKVREVDKLPESELKVSARSMENDLCIVEFNDSGEIIRYYDKSEKRELIDPAEPANRLQFFQDGPEGEAAWNVHSTFEGREYSAECRCRISVGETGPVRISLVVERDFRESRIVQEIGLNSGERQVTFHNQVDWRERQVLLKAAFPVQILADHATYEVQFGATRRPTHNNTSWEEEKFEVAAHRWVDLSEPGYGVSLLNDCKYGHDIKGHVMRISLLRGPESPDPDADLGAHEFTYAFLPHLGDWVTGETVKKAAELNIPVFAVLAAPGMAGRMSFATVEGPAVLDTVKPAEDGRGWIMRSYEPNGARGFTSIQFERKLERAEEVNAVEEHILSLDAGTCKIAFATDPFRIQSFRCVF